MYRTTISSRPQPAPELGDSDQLLLFETQAERPTEINNKDSIYIENKPDRPKLSLVRTDEMVADETSEDREPSRSRDERATEEECEPIPLEEPDLTRKLTVTDSEATDEHSERTAAEKSQDAALGDLNDMVGELELSLEEDLAIAEADLRAIAAELEEDISASAPMQAVPEAEPQAVILDEDLEPPPTTPGSPVVASGKDKSAAKPCCETAASPPPVSSGPDDTTLLSDEHLIEEEVEVLEEDSSGGIELEPAIGATASRSATVTGRPMPVLPARGEIAELARKGSTSPRPPKRIGGGRLVPTRLTWKPGEPAGLAKPRPKASFRWDTMLTTACITAVCGMGCLWLLRTILA